MKKFLLSAALVAALSLGACAPELAKVKQLYTIVTGTTVSPQAIVVVANAFDAIEGTATQYLIYCKANLSTPACGAANRRDVIKYVRVGRAARNQLETYLQQSSPAPSAIYNTLVAAVNALNAEPLTVGVGQ